MIWLITPEQTLSAARRAGLRDENLRLSGVAVLTFNRPIVERLEGLCRLEDAKWLGPQHHPYGGPHVVKRGQYRGLSVTVVVSPMGTSPLSCIIEDLLACGAEAVFLVCAAWSLGPPLEFGDLIVPRFSLGHDGTSLHYGNSSGRVDADPLGVEALAAAGGNRGATVHVGGNATCEALYRVSPAMVEEFQAQGCLCMENGEASTLFSVARTLGVPSGALFQPYIELSRGWDPGRLGDCYRAACLLQAEVVLDASLRLREQGLIGG